MLPKTLFIKTCSILAAIGPAMWAQQSPPMLTVPLNRALLGTAAQEEQSLSVVHLDAIDRYLTRLGKVLADPGDSPFRFVVYMGEVPARHDPIFGTERTVFVSQTTLAEAPDEAGFARQVAEAMARASLPVGQTQEQLAEIVEANRDRVWRERNVEELKGLLKRMALLAHLRAAGPVAERYFARFQGDGLSAGGFEIAKAAAKAALLKTRV